MAARLLDPDADTDPLVTSRPRTPRQRPRLPDLATLPMRKVIALALALAAVVGYSAFAWVNLGLVPAGLLALATAAAVIVTAKRRADRATREAEATPDVPWGRSPGHLRALAAVACVLFLVPIALAVDGHVKARSAVAALNVATGTINDLRAGSGGVEIGFAENCTALWLSAGTNPAGTAAFLENCNPGIPSNELHVQTAGTLEAASVTAYGPPLTRVEPTDPNRISVFVAVRLREWTVTPAADKTTTAAWADRGVTYYRVPVALNAATGRPALRGLPRQSSLPVDTEPLDLAADLTAADMADPRTATISAYLSRDLMAPPEDKPAEGSVANYLWPGSKAISVHSPQIIAVEVLKTSYTEAPDDPSTVNALAQAQVTYAGGNSTVQLIPLVLGQQGGTTWLVKALPGTPPLAAPTS